MGKAIKPAASDLVSDPQKPFVHRDLSWLFFNTRVLSEAEDPTNPLLERIKFLAITASNLDEFFMIRLLSVARNMERTATKDPKTHQRLSLIQNTILTEVQHFTERQNVCFQILKEDLQKEGISFIENPEPQTEAHDLSLQIFNEDVLPKLTSPEPFESAMIASLLNQESVAILSENQWIKIPRGLPQILFRKKDKKIFFITLDDLLKTFFKDLFKTEKEPTIVKLTRDGDFSAETDTESIPDIVKKGLSNREKGKPTRLQVSGVIDEKILSEFSKALKILPEQVFFTKSTLCLTGLWTVTNECAALYPEKPTLTYLPTTPYIVSNLKVVNSEIFDYLKHHDIFLHHPYDSFDTYVNFIRSACEDPNVIQIEQTVYRMDAVSPLIEALKGAAKKKKIRVVIELRARFDEFNNLKLGEDLREAGAEVAFGFGKLKLHAKVALVTRKEGSELKTYTHLSTGNYKASTARQYTDMAVITSNPGIGADARRFFDAVTEGKVPTGFTYLLHAPARMHRKLLAHIKAETKAAQAGKKARIFAKVNALVDETVVEHLYAASQAGVKVDLVVRGACSLVPGIPGISENITVCSIVDRYLEHSRIYYFENAGVIYLSSADWMPRNFFSRLELAFPVLTPRIHEFITSIVIPVYMQDNTKAWRMLPDGTWEKSSNKGLPRLQAQFIFQELATSQYSNPVMLALADKVDEKLSSNYLGMEDSLTDLMEEV